MLHLVGCLYYLYLIILFWDLLKNLSLFLYRMSCISYRYLFWFVKYSHFTLMMCYYLNLHFPGQRVKCLNSEIHKGFSPCDMYFTDNACTCTEIPDRLGRYRTSDPVVTELRIREWRLTTSGVLAPSVWDVESALLRAPSLPLVEPVSSGGLVDSRSSITRSMGILPFKQLMYRWQKLSHNSWTCRQTKNLTLLPHFCKF